jgi:hypothetical protein
MEAPSITLLVTAANPIILTLTMPRMDPITVPQKQAVTAMAGTVVTVAGMEAAMEVLAETGVAVETGVVAVAVAVVVEAAKAGMAMNIGNYPQSPMSFGQSSFQQQRPSAIAV